MAVLALLPLVSADALEFQQGSPLEHVRDIRRLSTRQAAAGLPVKLTGIVTALSGWKNSFFIEEGGEGISVDRTDRADVHPGDKVRLAGVTSPGLFAPIVLANRVDVIGRGSLPEPISAGYSDLIGGALDSQWVQVSGTVHAARIAKNWDRQVLVMPLDLGGGSIAVHVHDFGHGDYERFVDASVRVRGVCGTIFNEKRQFIGVRLFVPDLTQIQIEKPAPPNPFSIPEIPIARLMQFGTQSLTHRVRVTGVVTYQNSTIVYIQSGEQALRMKLAQPAFLAAGTRVDAVGFLMPGEYSPELHDTVVRSLGISRVPLPVKINASEAIQTKAGFTSAPYDGMLVQLEGQFVSEVENGHEDLFALRSGTVLFQARLERGAAGEGVSGLRTGSLLRLTGVCAIDADESREPRSFRLLLRFPTDISVVHTPWFTMAHSVWAIALLSLACFAMLAWILQIRHKLPFHEEDSGRTASPLAAGFRIASQLAGACAMCLAGVVIVGWIFDIAGLRSPILGGWQMKPNVAVAVLAAGLALILHTGDKQTKVKHNLFWLLAAITAAVGISAIIEHATGKNLHIDELLFRDPTPFRPGMPPGRMGLTASIELLLIGGALLLSRSRRFLLSAQHLSIAAAGIALLQVVGFLYGIQSFSSTALHITGMSIQSSVMFVLLCMGVLLARPDEALMVVVGSESSGGVLARRLLPTALFIPAFLGWLTWEGQLKGLYDPSFGLALFASAIMAIFTLLIWSSAAMLNRFDRDRSRAESRLRESVAHFRQLADAMPQIVWTSTPQGESEYFNQRWYEYTSFSFAETREWGWKRVLHPDDLERVVANWRSAIATRQPFEGEMRLKRGVDGAYRWHLSRAVPVFDSDGNVTAWFGTSTDIEEFKRAETDIRAFNETLEARVIERTAELRESEERFRTLVEGIRDYSIIMLDVNGNITSWNPGAERITGYTAADAIGQHMSFFHTPWDKEHNTAREVLKAAAETGRFEQEAWRIRKDGALFLEDVIITPLRDQSAKLQGFSKIACDITKRKLAEKEIAMAHGKLRGVLDAATQVAIIATALDGTIELFNTGAERMLQYQADEVIGRATPLLFHLQPESESYAESGSREAGRDISELDAIAEDARSGRTVDRELTFVRKDGSRLEVSLAVTAVRNIEGEIQGFLGIATDISARKVLDRELRRNNEMLLEQTRRAEEANRAKSEFLAAMSHEIRTPMNAILGMADVLSETELSADQHRYVEIFRRAGSNLLTLINDILDVSKIEAGHLELEALDFDLDDVVGQALELIGAKARLKNIRLVSRISPDVNTALSGDPTRLRQILLNLLGNAVKFTEQGEVALTIANLPEGKPGELDFAVSDTGVGIPADKIETIFENFTQADSSITRKYGGTGLGLGISRRLVQKMGGDISVTSVVGEGSTFRFTIPFALRDRKDEKAPEAVQDFHGRRVLAIDDDPANRLVLEETLAGWGFEADVFATPGEGLDALSRSLSENRAYSLALVDSRMPEMDGFATAEKIRASARIPVVMLASDMEPGHVTRRREAGIAGYAVKPVDRSELLRIICDAMKSPPTIPQPAAQPGSAEILLAEDSPDNRLLIEVYLKGTSYHLSFADNGKTAVEQFESRRFDLILMDVQMPVMDGLAATRAIRSIEQNRDLKRTPVIALTANARLEDIEAAKEAGCDGHVSKPVSKQKLLTAIKEILDRTVRAPIEFEIPEGLEEYVPVYIENRKQEFPALQEALQNSDFDALRIAGHNLKGTGTSYGFSGLSALGAALEHAAREADTPSLQFHLAELNAYLSQVELALQFQSRGMREREA